MMWCFVGEFSCFWHIFFHCLNAQVVNPDFHFILNFFLPYDILLISYNSCSCEY